MLDLSDFVKRGHGFLFYLIMALFCTCIQNKGPVCDSITVCKCKCSNDHLFKSVIRCSVMFVIIFSGSSALPLHLVVVGEVFPLVLNRLVLISF